MKIEHITDFKHGWVVGDFEPSIIRDKNIEVGVHTYLKGHKSDGHYHLIATEINIVVKGLVKVGVNNILQAGDIWTTYPKEINDVEFLENTELVVIKSPSIPGDKYYIDKTYPLYPEQLQEICDWMPNPSPEDMKAIFGELYEINSSNAGAGNTVDSTIHTEIQTDKIS